jgi:hypothetical protein
LRTKITRNKKVVRFLAILTLLGGIGAGIYYLLSTELADDINVTGKLQIFQQQGNYVNASQASDASYFAVVEGKIRNNSGKPIKNVFIKYIIAGQETSATVFDLAPGEEIKFNTRGVNTDASNPEYNFVGLCYD